jgi:hypothetical protein
MCNSKNFFSNGTCIKCGRDKEWHEREAEMENRNDNINNNYENVEVTYDEDGKAHYIMV